MIISQYVAFENNINKKLQQKTRPIPRRTAGLWYSCLIILVVNGGACLVIIFMNMQRITCMGYITFVFMDMGVVPGMYGRAGIIGVQMVVLPVD
jgi:hypothetical protein